MRLVRLLRSVLGRVRSSRQGAAAEPGRLAFAAVSSDPALLHRLPRDQARRLAEQARTAAQSLIGTAGSDPHGETRGAAIRVLRLVRDFSARDRVCGGSIDEMVLSADNQAADGLGGLLHALRADLPRLTDATARMSVPAVVALGAHGLRRLARADADRLMLAASRRAASCLRGEAGVTPSERGEGRAALSIVGDICAEWRTLPLAFVLAGDRRERAEHLVELWRDGMVCAEQANGGAHHRLWEDARDGHAFGAVWLMPQLLSLLIKAEAEPLSRDARAAASYVLNRGAGQAGVRGAMEAARAVLFSCGVVAAPPVSEEPEPVRPEGLPARAARA